LFALADGTAALTFAEDHARCGGVAVELARRVSEARLGGGDASPDVDRVASHSSRPVAAVIGRSRFTFSSTVVYPTPAGSSVLTAQPIAESKSVQARPPWTLLTGL